LAKILNNIFKYKNLLIMYIIFKKILDLQY